MCKMLEQSKYYFPIFEKALAAYNVPQVFKFLPVIESGLNAHAISKSGATGLWQFMYGTAKSYSLLINDYVDERKDPIQASYAAAKYLREAYNELGDWFLALAAYNCGTGAVKRAIIKAGGEQDIWKLQPYLSLQTQKYIPAFIAAVYVLSYPNKHQIFATNFGVTTQTDTIYVNGFVNLNKLCNQLSLPLNQLAHLNPSYKQQIIYGSKNSPKRLVLPQINKLMYANLYNYLNQNQNTDAYLAQEISKPQVPNIIVAEVEVEKTNLTSQQLQTNILETPVYTNYTVKLGDTLMAIAQQFKGLTVDKIKEINQLDGSILSIGCILSLVEISN